MEVEIADFLDEGCGGVFLYRIRSSITCRAFTFSFGRRQFAAVIHEFILQIWISLCSKFASGNSNY